MMNKRVIVLDKLDKQEYITFFSEGGKFDFKDKFIIIDVYFNGARRPAYKFSADGWVAGKKNTNLVQVGIPPHTQSAKIVMTSMMSLLELEQVLVFSDNFVPGWPEKTGK